MIGLVSASAGVYQWLTPRELLRYFAIGYGLIPDQAIERTRTLAEIMKLDSFLDRRCTQLSTGQAQRVNLARALIHDPPVVLLDEPTRGLDVIGAKVVFDYVQLLKEHFFLAAVLLGVAASPWIYEIVVLVPSLGIRGIDVSQIENVETLLASWREVPLVLIVLCLGIVPGICEECFFRGYLFNGLKQHLNATATIVVSAITFDF